MDFLKFSTRKSKLSKMLYFAMNVGLAVLLLLIVLAIDSPLPAAAIVLLSKWRVLAVRPRFWLANILANVVDLTVGLSIVVLLSVATGIIWLQVFLVVAYAGWLLFIKPRSKRNFVAVQAATAVFFGTTATLMLSHNIYNAVTVLLLWIIGYSAARHVLIHFEERHVNILAFCSGLFMAELGWVVSHWVIAYSLPGFGELRIVQAAIIVTAVGFMVYRAYLSRYLNGVIRKTDILMPTVLVVSLTLVLLNFFNDIGGIGGIN